jgi:hypothetical protein
MSPNQQLTTDFHHGGTEDTEIGEQMTEAPRQRRKEVVQTPPAGPRRRLPLGRLPQYRWQPATRPTPSGTSFSGCARPPWRGRPALACRGHPARALPGREPPCRHGFTRMNVDFLPGTALRRNKRKTCSPAALGWRTTDYRLFQPPRTPRDAEVISRKKREKRRKKRGPGQTTRGTTPFVRLLSFFSALSSYPSSDLLARKTISCGLAAHDDVLGPIAR